MSKNFFIITLFLLSACVEAGNSNMDDVIVHYFGFEISRITGLNEVNIVEKGCRYRASKELMMTVLMQSESTKMDYNPYNVRAKISIDNHVYFVDYYGVYEKNDSSFLIDKEKFVDLLD